MLAIVIVNGSRQERRERPPLLSRGLELYVVQENVAEFTLLADVVHRFDERIALRHAASVTDIDRGILNNCDAVLLELVLSDKRSADTVFRVRCLAPDTPLLVLSSENHAPPDGAIEFGVDDYIGKAALSAPSLVRTVRSAIKRRGLRRELEDAWSRANVSSQQDPLTGLLNRGAFIEKLSLAMPAAPKRDGQHALVFIDLDGLRQVNRALGHAEGDSLLLVVAKRIRESCGARDLVARVGGDKFVALLDGASATEAHEVAARLGAALRFEWRGVDQSVGVSASIGIALAAPGEMSVAGLFEVAGQAMVSATHPGGDGIGVGTPLSDSCAPLSSCWPGRRAGRDAPRHRNRWGRDRRAGWQSRRRL